MEWHRKVNGDAFKSVVQQAARSGATLAVLDDAPKLAEGLHFYWRAYNRLGTERNFGTIAGPIPYGKIIAYAERFGLDDTEYFAEVIMIVDAWDMTQARKKDDDNAAKSRTKTSKSR